MGHALFVDMVQNIGDMILTYNNCEENICAYNLENFLGSHFLNDTNTMDVNELQDSGHI